MIPPLHRWMDRIAESEESHRTARMWTFMLSAFRRVPAEKEVRRWITKRPITRALLIADVVLYPAWWAIWFVLQLVLVALLVPWGGLRELRWVGPAILAAVAGPSDPRTASRLLRGIANRFDPPPITVEWTRDHDGCFTGREVRRWVGQRDEP